MISSADLQHWDTVFFILIENDKCHCNQQHRLSLSSASGLVLIRWWNQGEWIGKPAGESISNMI